MSKYIIFIMDQADDIFHEVQHASMFAENGADGRGGYGSTFGTGATGMHHRWMLSKGHFDPHRSFLSGLGANQKFIERTVSDLMSQGGLTNKLPEKYWSRYVPEVGHLIRGRAIHMK
ncbi:hypothetical protein KAR48_03750 [bacterium]|nr:hypothetical protein [bacterium]